MSGNYPCSCDWGNRPALYIAIAGRAAMAYMGNGVGIGPVGPPGGVSIG